MCFVKLNLGWKKLFKNLSASVCGELAANYIIPPVFWVIAAVSESFLQIFINITITASVPLPRPLISPSVQPDGTALITLDLNVIGPAGTTGGIQVLQVRACPF